MRNMPLLLLGFGLLMSLSIGVNAISVASDYLQGNTMELISGTSNVYSIRLQNPTNAEVAIKLDYDHAFMKVIEYKEVYILPPKTSGYKILFNVTAPKKEGLYNLGYAVSEVEPSGGGLPIRLKINKNFNLKVIRDPNKFYIRKEHAAYAVIALVFLLYFYLSRKKAKKAAEKHSRRKQWHKKI